MDPRPAFLEAATMLVSGFTELASYRVVGNTATISAVDANVINREKYSGTSIPLVDQWQSVSPTELVRFERAFHESTMVLAYSWMESFLGEVEEALYLNEPNSLGDNIQIKLGKLIESDSIEQVIHDLVRKRIKERSQWGLLNRLSELVKRHRMRFAATPDQVKWVATVRNDIIHNRRVGQFQVDQEGVTYELVERKMRENGPDTEQFLGIIAGLVVDLYENTCSTLEVTNAYARHEQNLKIISTWREMWSSPSPSNESLQPTP